MPIQPVEFDFPEPVEDALEVAGAENSLEVDLTPTPKEPTAPKKETANDAPAAVEVEVIDDTPPEDRNRKPGEPPEDIAEDELETYSEKVQQRIRRFTKGYHDERRAKEQALREREEAVRIAKNLLEENNQLKGRMTQGNTLLLEQARKVVENDLAAAKRAYTDAYNAGDADAMAEAQANMAVAAMRAEQLKSQKISGQPPKNGVEVAPSPETAPAPAKPAAEPTKVELDPRTQTWYEANPWFGQDEHPEKTAFALGMDQKLRSEGFAAGSEEYYEALDARMRKTFPDFFKPKGADRNPSPAPTSVVAPATRSNATTKVRLTKTQVALANEMGVPLEVYAREVAKNSGGKV